MSNQEEDGERRRPRPFDYSLFPMPPRGHARVGVQTEANKVAESRQQQQQATTNANVDQARTNLFRSLSERISSPRKEGYGPTRGGYNSATAPSKLSERKDQAVAATLAMLEGVDEETNRAKIEALSEKKLFKLTGQVPPTPTTGIADENGIYIRREDLRARCRVANEEQQLAPESVKSPKKKLLAIRNLFKRTSTEPAPHMPTKAAEVFGTVPRQHRVVEARPIMPARVFELTPTKPSRSDTTKSLPGKIVDPHSYARRRRADSPRRNRSNGCSLPGRGSPSRQRGGGEKTPATKAGVSSESAIPPTPPAKDTPPEFRVQSPLRRADPISDLRETYETYETHESGLGEGVGLRFPEFKQTPPLAPKDQSGNVCASPEISHKLDAEAYRKLILGEVTEWPYAEHTDSLPKPEGKRALPLPGAKLDTLQLPAPNRDHHSRIAPRFYSPLDPPACGFAEGESPSKNSDPSRMLYSVPPNKPAASLHQISKDTIKMMYQGSASDIDPNSPTGRELMQNQSRTKTSHGRSDTEITSRVMQELRIGEKHMSAPQMSPQSGYSQPVYYQPGQSRLTDILNTAGSGRSESQSSAMPSPLHIASGQALAMRPHTLTHGSFGGPQRIIPETIEDHFFMTNEHLDVVGKTTWDLLEGIHKQQKAKSKAQQEQLMVHMDAQFSKANEDAYRTIIKALAEQDKKMLGIQADIKDMKQMLKNMQSTPGSFNSYGQGQAK